MRAAVGMQAHCKPPENVWTVRVTYMYIRCRSRDYSKEGNGERGRVGQGEGGGREEGGRREGGREEGREEEGKEEEGRREGVARRLMVLPMETVRPHVHACTHLLVQGRASWQAVQQLLGVLVGGVQ